MKVLGLIPARGGSKGIPRKNVALLGGKPLIAWTAEAALAARRLDRVILSTDDAEIARVGEALGIDVPFRRPQELANDTAPTLPVVRHALEWCEQRGDRYDAVCLLQPTSPFRRPEEIDGSIELLARTGADCVISVLPVPHQFHPEWVYMEAADGSLRISTGAAAPISRRQDLPGAYHRDGSVYVTRRDVVMTANSLYGERVFGYPADAASSVNLDTFDDWRQAEKLIASRTILAASA